MEISGTNTMNIQMPVNNIPANDAVVEEVTNKDIPSQPESNPTQDVNLTIDTAQPASSSGSSKGFYYQA